MKVRKAFKEGSDLVRLDKAEGYKADEELFRKYLIDSNVEDVEEVEEESKPQAIKGERLTSVYLDMLDRLEAEVERYREDNKALYERVVELTANQARITALLESTAKPDKEYPEEEAEPHQKPIEATKTDEEESISPKVESGLKELKKPSFDMPDSTFYIIIAAIIILGGVGLYLVETLN